MKKYKIMLTTVLGDGAYLVGEGNSCIGIPGLVWSGNSFQTTRTDAAILVFSENEENSKIIEGKTNLKSWLNRLLDQLPYYTLDIATVTIITLEEE